MVVPLSSPSVLRNILPLSVLLHDEHRAGEKIGIQYLSNFVKVTCHFMLGISMMRIGIAYIEELTAFSKMTCCEAGAGVQ